MITCSKINSVMGFPWSSSSWDSVLPRQGAQVWFLVRELRSHTPHGTTNNNKVFIKENIIITKLFFFNISSLMINWDRRHGFNPWSRKIPHAVEQQSTWGTTIAPVLWSLGASATEGAHSRACTAQKEKPSQWEVHEPPWESIPLSPQLERAHAALKTQRSQKIKYTFKK